MTDLFIEQMDDTLLSENFKRIQDRLDTLQKDMDATKLQMKTVKEELTALLKAATP